MTQFEYRPQDDNLNQILDCLDAALTARKVSGNRRFSTRLILEELACKLQPLAEADAPLFFEIGNAVGGLVVDVRQRGSRLSLDYETQADIGSNILSAYAEKITLSYRRGENIIAIAVKQPVSQTYRFSVLAAAAGMVIGLMDYYLNGTGSRDSTPLNLFVTRAYTPFTDFVNCLVSPLTVFTIFWLIIKYMKKWDRTNNRILQAYLSTSIFGILAPLVAAVPLGRWLRSVSSVGRSYDVVLDVERLLSATKLVPENILSPLIESNPVQLLFLAVFCGIATLSGNIDSSLGGVIKGIRDLLCQMMHILGYFYPLVILLVSIDVFSYLGAEAIVMVLLYCVCIATGCVLLYSARGISLVRNGISPKKLYSVLHGDILEIIREGSCLDMSPYMVRAMRHHFRIPQRDLALLIPLGCEINMDAGCICSSACFFFMLFYLAGSVPMPLIAVCCLMILLLSVGVANQPCSSIATYTMLFSLIGLQIADASTVILADVLVSGLMAGFNAIGTMIDVLVLAKRRDLIPPEVMARIALPENK